MQVQLGKTDQAVQHATKKPWSKPLVDVSPIQDAQHGAPPGVNDGIGFFQPAS